MASTNKTANLGLPQWEASDPFSRTEMNESFQRIDSEAVRRRLFTVEVKEDAEGLELDFSGVDLARYAFLVINFDLSDYRDRHFLINNYTESHYVEFTGSASSRSFLTMKGGTLQVNYLGDEVTTRSEASPTFGRVSWDWLKDDRLRTITFIKEEGKMCFTAGDKIHVWGELK